jgi:hypothetical protein
LNKSSAQNTDTKKADQEDKIDLESKKGVRIYGKLDANYHLSNKKALFWNMTNYYKRLNTNPFQNLPLTFHIENGLDDNEFRHFKTYFNQLEQKKTLQTKKLRKAIKAEKKKCKKESTFSILSPQFNPSEIDPDNMSYAVEEHM